MFSLVGVTSQHWNQYSLDQPLRAQYCLLVIMVSTKALPSHIQHRNILKALYLFDILHYYF